jgi:hypothetical protein
LDGGVLLTFGSVADAAAWLDENRADAIDLRSPRLMHYNCITGH